MKSCEMCKGKAQMHCASDQASLCWACAAKVHSANSLAARHSRNLLCCICQGPTPWSAAGAKLRPIPSACDQCVDGNKGDGDEEELWVVPFLPTPPPPSPPAEGFSSGGEAVVLAKRFRTNNASINIRSDEHKSPIFIPPAAASATVASACGRKTTVLPKIRRADSGRADTCESGIWIHREKTGSGRAEF